MSGRAANTASSETSRIPPTRGTARASSGWLQYLVAPTTLGPAPSANRISVALGCRDTIRGWTLSAAAEGALQAHGHPRTSSRASARAVI